MNQNPIPNTQNPIPKTRNLISLTSPIEEKIAWARSRYREFGDALIKERGIADLLNNLKDAAAASRKEMARTGIVEICRRCDQEEGGSCCGAGIENRYDAWLLLINLLLGARLPEERRQANACYLSGENGCLLIARHIICINYLCKKVTDQINPRKITPLREKEGTEVNILFILHERIKSILKKWIND